MSARVASWLAWSLAGVSVAMFLASAALYVLARSAQSPSNWVSVDTVSGLLSFVPFLAFPLVGALIASRRPHNPIGWICLADGFLWMFIDMTDYYSIYGVASPGSVPFPVANRHTRKPMAVGAHSGAPRDLPAPAVSRWEAPLN